MLIEKNLKEALADYIKGKPVTVLWTKDDGSMDVRLLSDILDQEENHFLVNVPAYHNPEFAQAVAEMVDQNRPDNCSVEVEPAGITEKDGSTTPPPLTESDPIVIPAENKREKALELAKEGKGAAEIARLIDAKYSTVYSWLNPDKCKKPKPENKTASNADRHKCRTCMFRATGNTRGAGCSYIEITGHSRGCSVEECSVYQKGNAVSKRKMKKFYE